MSEETKTATAKERFAKAWLSVKNPPLDGTNPHFRSKYATLKSTLAVIRDACNEHGIAYVQEIRTYEDGTCDIKSSVICAETGDFYTLSVVPISATGTAQQFGAELTYKKRQQAQTDWGLAGEEDDDGESIKEGPFMAHCRSCGARYQFQDISQMSQVQCCPHPDYEVE